MEERQQLNKYLLYMRSFSLKLLHKILGKMCTILSGEDRHIENMHVTKF